MRLSGRVNLDSEPKPKLANEEHGAVEFLSDDGPVAGLGGAGNLELMKTLWHKRGPLSPYTRIDPTP